MSGGLADLSGRLILEMYEAAYNYAALVFGALG